MKNKIIQTLLLALSLVPAFAFADDGPNVAGVQGQVQVKCTGTLIFGGFRHISVGVSIAPVLNEGLQATFSFKDDLEVFPILKIPVSLVEETDPSPGKRYVGEDVEILIRDTAGAPGTPGKSKAHLTFAGMPVDDLICDQNP